MAGVSFQEKRELWLKLSRNLVSHANDIEPEIKSFREIKFDKTFVTTLLELMTINNPKLLVEICDIKPIL